MTCFHQQHMNLNFQAAATFVFFMFHKNCLARGCSSMTIASIHNSMAPR
jgi:hypothetical protein